MDGGAWWAAVHGVVKSRTRLSNFTFTFHFHALEKERATHSSVLAWRILGTGEPGGCYLWASQVMLVVKNPPSDVRDVRDTGLIPGLGRSPGGGHGNPLQYS